MKFILKFVKGLVIGSILKAALFQLVENRASILNFLDGEVIKLIHRASLPKALDELFADKDEAEVRAKLRMLVRVIIEACINAIIRKSDDLMTLLSSKLKD